MTTIRVHFDGKVLVPDEPADLPVGKPLVAEVSDAKEEPAPAVPPSRWRLINELDPETVQAIGEDPEFDLENA